MGKCADCFLHSCECLVDVPLALLLWTISLLVQAGGPSRDAERSADPCQ